MITKPYSRNFCADDSNQCVKIYEVRESLITSSSEIKVADQAGWLNAASVPDRRPPLSHEVETV